MRKLILVFGLLFPALSQAQQYSINWHSITAGGGTSSNAQYSVSGTIGQPDAGGSMAAGNYSLTGGFWAIYAVLTPGAPLLTISLAGSSAALISWPAPATGFSLQQNSSLSTTNWTSVTNSTNVVNGTNQVLISPAAGNNYFRLVHP